uniref:type IV secretion system protein n=1 Tax=Snodgrassella sp. CFCC 13594 TaxID=1775559 RepID=UPI000AFAA925
MSTSSVFGNLAETFTVKLGTDLFSNASSLISSIAPIFSAGFGLYLLLVAINAYNRGLDENILDISKRAMGWLVIIALAFNAGQYAKLANLIYNMPEGLSSVFGKSFSVNAFDASAEKLSALLDKLAALDNRFNVLQVGSHLNMFGISQIVALCGWAILGVSFAFYVVAKISLALVLMVGPLFLGCMLFPATRNYGMNWIGQCANYILNVVMFTLLCAMLTSYFDSKVSEFGSSPLDSIAAALLLPAPFLLMTFLFLIVAWNIPSITTALTG